MWMGCGGVGELEIDARVRGVLGDEGKRGEVVYEVGSDVDEKKDLEEVVLVFTIFTLRVPHLTFTMASLFTIRLALPHHLPMPKL